MSQHRLPIFRPEPPTAEAFPGVPTPLPGRAISVLDTSDGGASLAFAALFLREIARRGRVLPIAFAGFESPPRSARERALFDAGQPMYGLPGGDDAAAIAARLGDAARGLWVVVGQAALAFAPALTVVVDADLPILRWPEPLRAARDRVSLCLAGDGLSVAAALARALSDG